jgi:SAM-dependent methyltransferase
MIPENSGISYRYLSKIYDTCKSSFWENYSRFLNPYFQGEKKSVLDLGCGTGLAIDYLKCEPKDYKGVDYSTEMLEVARKKFPDHLFYTKSILEVDFAQQFDFVLAAFDTLNHFLSPGDWKKVFNIASQHLGPNGKFVFDVFSTYDLEVNWPNQLNLTESEDWVYVQRSTYDPKSKIGSIKNTIFQKEGSNWLRLDDTIANISFPIAEITILLAEAGLTCLQIVDLETGKNATDTSATLAFVCEKKIN